MYVHVIYMSISCKVRRFAEHLKQYALQQHCISEDSPLISLSEIRKDTSPIELRSNFFVILPTYTVTFAQHWIEILTTPMHHHLKKYNNYEKCLGFIGAGDASSGMYAITARAYANHYKAPFLTAFESHGTEMDVERIYSLLKFQAIQKIYS